MLRQGRISDPPEEEALIADERDRTRINEMIRLSPVRLVDADGSQVGIVPVEEALALARTRGLDLVERHTVVAGHDGAWPSK